MGQNRPTTLGKDKIVASVVECRYFHFFALSHVFFEFISVKTAEKPSYLTCLGCNNSMVRITSMVSLQSDDGSWTLAPVALFA